MRPILLLAVCGRLGLKVGCDCSGEMPRFEPCVEDGGTLEDGGSGGGTGAGTGVGGGATGIGGGATGGGAGGAFMADGGGVIPFDQLCDTIGTAFGAALDLNSHTACTPLVSRQDALHLPLVQPLLGPVTLGDLIGLFGCDGGLAVSPLLALVAIDTGLLPRVPPNLGDVLARAAASIDAGRMAYDPAAAWRCRELGRQLRDAGTIDSFDPFADAGVCDQVLVGLVALGGACSNNDECASWFCRPSGPASCGGVCRERLSVDAGCDPDRDKCQGACVLGATGYRCDAPYFEPPPVDAGASPTIPIGMRCPGLGNCDSSVCVTTTGADAGVCTVLALTGQRCGAGADGFPPCSSSCERCGTPDGGPRVCVTRDVGGACEGDGDCLEFHYCSIAGTATFGTCRLRPRPGEACLTAGPVGLGNCMWGDTFCRPATPDAGTGTCTMLPALGEPCGLAYDQHYFCRGNTYCRLDAGRCVPPSGAGQSCDDDVFGFGFCQWGLICIDGGTCQPYPRVGEPCALRACALGAYCGDAGTCLAQSAAGAPCVDDQLCAGGLCSKVTSTCSTRCNEDDPNSTPPACSCPSARFLTFFLVFAAVFRPRAKAQRKAPSNRG